MKANPLRIRSARGEIALSGHLASEDAKPDFYLVHPGSMIRRVMEDEAMGSVGEKSGARFHRLQNTRQALDTEVIRDIGFLGRMPDQGFRTMSIEIIDDMPLVDFQASPGCLLGIP